MLTIQGHCSGYWNTVMPQSDVQLIRGIERGVRPLRTNPSVTLHRPCALQNFSHINAAFLPSTHIIYYVILDNTCVIHCHSMSSICRSSEAASYDIQHPNKQSSIRISALSETSLCYSVETVRCGKAARRTMPRASSQRISRCNVPQASTTIIRQLLQYCDTATGCILRSALVRMSRVSTINLEERTHYRESTPWGLCILSMTTSLNSNRTPRKRPKQPKSNFRCYQPSAA